MARAIKEKFSSGWEVFFFHAECRFFAAGTKTMGPGAS
jgi:hypothetical protein